LCLLGGFGLPRPVPRRNAAIEIFDRDVDEVSVREIFLGKPELMLQLSLCSGVGASHGSGRRGHAMTLARPVMSVTKSAMAWPSGPRDPTRTGIRSEDTLAPSCRWRRGHFRGRGYPKKQLPMWHQYRVELYPHYGQLSGIRDTFGNELEFPSAFRLSRRDGRPRGIIKIGESS
jgi:hypothetical protein